MKTTSLFIASIFFSIFGISQNCDSGLNLQQTLSYFHDGFDYCTVQNMISQTHLQERWNFFNELDENLNDCNGNGVIDGDITSFINPYIYSERFKQIEIVNDFGFSNNSSVKFTFVRPLQLITSNVINANGLSIDENSITRSECYDVFNSENDYNVATRCEIESEKTINKMIYPNLEYWYSHKIYIPEEDKFPFETNQLYRGQHLITY